VDDELQKELQKRGIHTIDEYHSKDLYWFIVKKAIPKLTKNKKPYLLLTISGTEGSESRMFYWGWNGNTDISEFSVCVAEIDRSDFGFSTRSGKIKVIR